ncbi:UNVERIFIED_CONTAM: hypothetical protein Scaly_1078000 [Sesamum calycinum]|uniref:Uncharacterized protein n=1 Tax=Sesamum calycinum TaxID=2727403 RepID=A0AAW2QM05_9LAMI
MATPSEARAVKSLNKSSGGRRFVVSLRKKDFPVICFWYCDYLTNFVGAVQDIFSKNRRIDIDVYRSLDPLKAEPSQGSSFFRDCLIEYRAQPVSHLVAVVAVPTSSPSSPLTVAQPTSSRESSAQLVA